MKLLLVNDEQLIANSIKRDVDWGFCGIREVFLAFSAEEARKLLLLHRPDILLLDIEMPNENGISVLRWARKQRELKNIECIFLTCHANFDYAREAVTLGCLDYVLMPARKEEIEQSIRKVVARICARQEDNRLKEYGKQFLSTIREEVLEEQNKGKVSKEEFVRETVNYIMDNLSSEELSINQVAAYLYLTPTYLNRIFKQERGESIGQFIIRERMELAKKLLEDGKLNSNVVAVKVGYPSYPHFSTMFKKHFGYPPSQLAKKTENE